MSPTCRLPSSTWWPPYQRMATIETVGRKSTSGMNPLRSFAAASARSRTLSAAASSRRTCCCSAPKPLTTRIPARLSSTTPETPASSSCSAWFTGAIRFENRVAAMLSNGSAPSASTASTTFFQQHDREHAAEREHRRDRERDQDHRLLDLLDVGVGAGHELTRLGAVVEREVQLLQMGEQAVPQIGLRAQRDPERRVAAEPGRQRLHHPDEHHEDRQPDDLALVPDAHAVVDGRGGDERHDELGGGPHDPGRDTTHDPGPLRTDRVEDESPTGAPQPAVRVGRDGVGW